MKLPVAVDCMFDEGGVDSRKFHPDTVGNLDGRSDADEQSLEPAGGKYISYTCGPIVRAHRGWAPKIQCMYTS